MEPGDIDMHNLSAMMDGYLANDYKPDSRDDLIAMQHGVLLNALQIVEAYATKYGADEECGVFE